jgi:hypothetical protein
VIDTWGWVCPVMRARASATAMKAQCAGGSTPAPSATEGGRVDEGCQFTSKGLDLWTFAKDTLSFPAPQVTDNAYANSFNASVRFECLGQHCSWIWTTRAKRSNNGAESTTK